MLDIANDATVLSVVERYLGTVPTILGMSAWWSFADPMGATEAQLFHVDIDDLRFCKMFIYLTDVEKDTGPFTYMEGTHDLEYIGDIRQQWPGGVAEFDNWYRRTLRKTDGQIKRVFGCDPVQITGPGGTLFVSCTANTSIVTRDISPPVECRVWKPSGSNSRCRNRSQRRSRTIE